MLKGSENGYYAASLTLISIVIIKLKRGVGSHIEKGWDSPNSIWVSYREELGPTESDLGPSVEKSSEPPRVPPSTYRDTCKAGGFEGAIWV